MMPYDRFTWSLTASLILLTVVTAFALETRAEAASAEGLQRPGREELEGDTFLPPEFVFNVQLAAGENEYLIVGDGPYGVVASRIDVDGAVLDDPPFQVDPRGRIMAVSFDGTDYFAVYVDDLGAGAYALLGRRIATSGGTLTMPDAEPVRIAGGGAVPAGNVHTASVSWGAGYFLVTWYRLLGGFWDIATIRVAADGTVVGEPVSVPAFGSGAAWPAASFDGMRFFVAWTTGMAIEGAFIDPATGSVGAPFPISTNTGDPATFHVTYPTVVWSGSHYLVVWSEGTWDSMHITAAMVTSAGELMAWNGPGVPMPEPGTQQQIVDSSWSGSEFVVSWNEGMTGCTIDPCPAPELDMRFVRLDGNGNSRVARPTQLGRGYLLADATRPQGRTLFIYLKNDRLRLGFGRETSRSRPIRR